MHSFITRNNLLSPQSLDSLGDVTPWEGPYGLLADIFTRFQDMKKFASEIHTETHLVKPLLKILGYTYESKPKFFEDQIKGPDVALFADEAEMVKSAGTWGTEEYYEKILAFLLLKRYGRPLTEGVSGFYLDFENRIPLYQTYYLLKKTRTPWGILTNGKNWIVLQRPVHLEMRLLEIDLESYLADNDLDVFRVFFNIFSCHGLKNVIPQLMEKERIDLISSLQSQRKAFQTSLRGLKKKADIYSKAIQIHNTFVSGQSFPVTEPFLGGKVDDVTGVPGVSPSHGAGETPQICSYLFFRRDVAGDIDLQKMLNHGIQRITTKDELLSQRILTMTPGFGGGPTQLVDNIAYLSFLLPYKDKNTFIAEWENEKRLKQYIVDRMLFGIERSPFSLDILSASIKERYGSDSANFKLGNPLIGMSISDLLGRFDGKNQTGLFDRNPADVIQEFQKKYELHRSLSEKIKEDAVVKKELTRELTITGMRIRDILDAMTATYFNKKVDNRKIQDMLASLNADESVWQRIRSKDWFVETKDLSRKHGFFHMEIEYPFLLTRGFDLIICQPDMNYLWEDEFPLGEALQAYIKRGMPYLKPDGLFTVILSRDRGDDVLARLQGSKRYRVLKQDTMFLLTRIQTH